METVSTFDLNFLEVLMIYSIFVRAQVVYSVHLHGPLLPCAM